MAARASAVLYSRPCERIWGPDRCVWKDRIASDERRAMWGGGVRECNTSDGVCGLGRVEVIPTAVRVQYSTVPFGVQYKARRRIGFGKGTATRNIGLSDMQLYCTSSVGSA